MRNVLSSYKCGVGSIDNKIQQNYRDHLQLVLRIKHNCPWTLTRVNSRTLPSSLWTPSKGVGEKMNEAAVSPEQHTIWWCTPLAGLEAVCVESWAAKEHLGHLAEDRVWRSPANEENKEAVKTPSVTLLEHEVFSVFTEAIRGKTIRNTPFVLPQLKSASCELHISVIVFVMSSIFPVHAQSWIILSSRCSTFKGKVVNKIIVLCFLP